MKNIINVISINIVSRFVVDAIKTVFTSIWKYAAPKLRERFARWKWRRRVRNETERVDFGDFKNFEKIAELMPEAFRESMSIKEEDSFIVCTEGDQIKSLKWKKINSRLRRTARKQQTPTKRFNVCRHVNNSSNSNK